MAARYRFMPLIRQSIQDPPAKTDSLRKLNHSYAVCVEELGVRKELRAAIAI
jgi:hypothetical protein